MHYFSRLLRGLLLTTLCCTSYVYADDHQSTFDYCFVCHGSQLQGNESVAGPNLTTLPKWYLQDALQSFRKGWRGPAGDPHGNEMAVVAQQLSPEESAAVLSFINQQPDVIPSPTITGNVSAGEHLYTTCAACHGAQGQGNAAVHAPPLVGLNDWYLASQLRRFKAHQRAYSTQDTWAQTMLPQASMLTDEDDINNVIAYINTLAPTAAE